MDPIQDLIAQWWVNADSTTQTAAIAFGICMLIVAVFSIVGTYTNPSRRPHNEIDFRKFHEANLAAEARRLSQVAEREPEPDNYEPTEPKFPYRRA